MPCRTESPGLVFGSEKGCGCPLPLPTSPPIFLKSSFTRMLRLSFWRGPKALRTKFSYLGSSQGGDGGGGSVAKARGAWHPCAPTGGLMSKSVSTVITSEAVKQGLENGKAVSLQRVSTSGHREHAVCCVCECVLLLLGFISVL